MDGWLLVPTEQGHDALRWDWIREFRDNKDGCAEIRYAPPNEPGGIMRSTSTMSTKQLLKSLVSVAKDAFVFEPARMPCTDNGFSEWIEVERTPIEQIKKLLQDHGWGVIGSHKNEAGVLSFHILGRAK